MAPCYFILAGVQEGEGAVISRGRNDAVDTWTIADNIENSWFLVQTNDDHWLPPGDDRRDATNQHMNRFTPKTMNATSMFQVMNTRPTRNELTTYTAVINPREHYYFAVTQYPDEEKAELSVQ